MQIVIDIPYKDFEKLATLGQFNPLDLAVAVGKGIVLPEGHGRLIDAEELVRQSCVQFYTTNYFGHITKMIDEAPTVLEAESEDGNE